MSCAGHILSIRGRETPGGWTDAARSGVSAAVGARTGGHVRTLYIVATDVFAKPHARGGGATAG